MDLLYLLAAAIISPKVIYRMIRQNRYRAGWGQRFGRIARKDPQKRAIWLHAVSVGEVNAAKTVIAGLEDRFPDFEILITTTTDTGFARAKTLFGDRFCISYFPLDFSWTMRRAFANIRPAICLLMELEVWPNFVRVAERLNVPVVVVNGRISDKSVSRYRAIKPMVKSTFGRVSLVLAQTAEYGERFMELGCPAEKVVVTGSLKYDTAQIAERVEGADVLERQLNLGAGRLWVAGGTGNDEEKILLDVFSQLKKEDRFGDLRLAIVPRKPERFDEVAELIKSCGFGLARYSEFKSGGADRPNDDEAVILGDTMGDLRKFYSLARIIFVGRSLVRMGGSDMMEAAALGKCTMFGPHAFNFKQTVEALLEAGGAMMVKDGDELLESMRKCLGEPQAASRIAESGRKVIRKNQGATARSIEQIARFLKGT
jgi:3-deoxy-D-manno-octulosonic-acid transferase